MFRDHTPDVDLEICLPKPFTTESIPAFAAAAPFIDLLRQSLLARRWPEVRAIIKSGFLNAHVEQLTRKLDAAAPGLVEFIDAHVDAIRSASRVLPGFTNQVYQAACMNDARSYLYWKYSRDVLGKPAGLTKTSLERQLGLGHHNMPVSFRFPCPNCCADAECEADGVGDSVPHELRMHCLACGHVDHHQTYCDHVMASHVLCGCAYCVAETRRAGAELERLQSNLIPALVSQVRAEIAAMSARAVTARHVDGHAEAAVRDFAAQWAGGGEGDFADAVNAWVTRRHPRLLHPHAYLGKVWKLIDALAGAGAVSITVAQEADDDQHVVEDLVLDKAMRFKRAGPEQQREEHEQATALTNVMMGFELDKPDSLADWLRALSEVGLFDQWFTLPCDIVCRLDPRHLAQACDSEAAPPAPPSMSPAPELQAAIALLRAHGYLVYAPE